MTLRVAVLGSGGWIPTEKRETCSALVRFGKKAILIDAGTGIRRLLDQSFLDEVEETALILTHFHLDHLAGMAYLAGVMPTPPVVYAPANFLYEQSSRNLLERVMLSPYHPVALEETAGDIKELRDENDILGLSVFARKQTKHSIATAGLRISDDLVYLTDTSFDEDNISFARGVKTMFHEAWYVDAEESWDTHSSGKEAGMIAESSAVNNLYLIHINPLLDERHILSDAQMVFPSAELAYDLQEIIP
jgi:ribonuclease BN (tRNA processing enzyme)